MQKMDAKIIQYAVYIYILSILTYTTPTWYLGYMHINKNNKTIRNNVDGYFKILDKAWKIILHAIFLIRKMTSIKIM